MNTNKLNTIYIVATMVFFLVAGTAFAQENTVQNNEETSTVNETSEVTEEIGTTEVNIDEPTEPETPVEEGQNEPILETEEVGETDPVAVPIMESIPEVSVDYSDQEFLETVLENATEITDESEGIFFGEVVAVDNEFILIQQSDNSYIKIPQQSSNSGQRKRTGLVEAVKNLKAGQSVVLLPSNPVLTTGIASDVTATSLNINLPQGKKSFAINSSTPVIVNNSRLTTTSELASMNFENNIVSVVEDENGEVYAITVISDENVSEGDLENLEKGLVQKSGKNNLRNIIIGAIILLIVALFIKRRK